MAFSIEMFQGTSYDSNVFLKIDDEDFETLKSIFYKLPLGIPFTEAEQFMYSTLNEELFR